MIQLFAAHLEIPNKLLHLLENLKSWASEATLLPLFKMKFQIFQEVQWWFSEEMTPGCLLEKVLLLCDY